MSLEFVSIWSAIFVVFSLPINFFVAWVKVEEVEGYLKYSSFVVMFKYMFQGGLFDGKVKRLFAVALVILIPRVFQWRGLVLVDDVENIPRSLRLWMVIPFLFTMFSLVAMIVSGLLLIYRC
ncbi:hypothetical protein [Pseudomonas brenneri]|uniref:hypothetical protein n=1 Tax=Pseudomonas brenneri TaxID=129817 RepID=UPI0028D7DABD|nr:hypothetical protein [Pseudomonas brenneri]